MRNTLVLTAALVVFGCTCIPASAQQRRPPTIFERAAELLTPRRAARPVAPQAVLAPAAMPANPRNAAAATERKERVTAHMRAMAAWIEAVCEPTADQKVKLTEIAAASIKRAQEEWRRLPQQNWQNGNRDFIPFEFIVAARKMTRHAKLNAELKAVLTEAQNQKLKTALEEREAAVGDNLVGLAVVVLDQELFLSPDKREPVAEEIRDMFGTKLYPGLYSFYNNSWPFRRAQFARRASLKKVLGEKRYARYQRLTTLNGQGDQHVMITMNNGDGETAFRKAIDEQPARMAEAMAVRILFMAETEGLTEAQQRKLTLAAKGAASRVIDRWVESSEKQMQSMRERFVNQNVSWGMSLPQVAQLESNKLWTVTCSKIRSQLEAENAGKAEETELQEEEEEEEAKKKRQARELLTNVGRLLSGSRPEPKPIPVPEAIGEREEFQRKAMVNYLVAMIDQEVWLRDDQRPRLHALLEKSVSEFSRYSRYSNYYLELQMLADALYVPREKDIKELLDERQFRAWEALKKQFKMQPNNIIKLTYRYGDVQFQFIAGRGRRR